MEFMASVVTTGFTFFFLQRSMPVFAQFMNTNFKSQFVIIDSIIDSLHKGFKM